MAKEITFTHIPLFRGFTPSEHKKILGLAQKKTYAKGKVIFKEGQEGDALYVVISGVVSIEKQPLMETTDAFSMLYLEQGEFFGELAIFGKGKRTSTARAAVECVLLSIPESKIEKCLRDDPCLAARIFKNMIKIFASRSRQVNLELMAFYETGKLLSAPYTADSLLEKVLYILISSLDAAQGAIILKNVFNGNFEVKAVKGYMKERMQSLDVATTGLGAKVLQEAKPLLIANILRETQFKDMPRLGFEKKTMLLVPFGLSQEKTGLLILAGKRGRGNSFTNDDVPLASAIMRQVATVLENTQFRSDEEARARLQRQYYTF